MSYHLAFENISNNPKKEDYKLVSFTALLNIKEEENARTLIDSLKMIKDNGYGLYMLDKELTARVYTQASPLANAE